MILLHGVEKIYGRGDNSVKALNEIDLEIRQGEWWASWVSVLENRHCLTLLDVLIGLL
ncbi:hypothetical protein [Syntrophaceticus schinkii]|uniref:Uncharacterized protein n=1 Tax=Syntrophaceticus schinkii TaxID=499207 RepID=A0A0B7ML16_9FIRM|nr:hypothetical protein [Syntrophaceticus schinkii]CEO88888.1 hypothetical protein SSCH_2930002 [Syntrophaceticus schinkii]